MAGTIACVPTASLKLITHDAFMLKKLSISCLFIDLIYI